MSEVEFLKICNCIIVYKQLIVRGKSDEERQDTGLLWNEEGDDGESKEGAQGPWKPVPTVEAQTPPIKPTQVPEPGSYDMTWQ